MAIDKSNEQKTTEKPSLKRRLRAAQADKLTAEQKAERALTRTHNAENELAVMRAMGARRWMQPREVEAAIRERLVRADDDTPAFTSSSGEDLVDSDTVAAQIAQANPHWVKASIKPGTGANGTGQGSAPAKATYAYEELMKPGNEQKLEEMMATRPKEYARARQEWMDKN